MSATSAAADDARSQQPSILTILSGSVFARHGSAPFAAATDGEMLAVGDVVQTAADAHAIVTMFEGSTIEIEPSTQITIDDASRRETSTFILFTQLFGRTWHVVTHLLTPDSRYDVRTPAATASVRGTVFEVAVLETDGATPGTTSVTTLQGAVATSDRVGTHVVLVTAAMTTTVSPGAAPAEPRPAPDVTHVLPVRGAGTDAPRKLDASGKSDDGDRGNGASDSNSGSAARGESGGNGRVEGNANASARASETSPRSAAASTEAGPSRREPAATSHAAASSLRASVVPTFSLPAIPIVVAESPKANANAKPTVNEASGGRASSGGSQTAPEARRADPVTTTRANDRDGSGDQGRRR